MDELKVISRSDAKALGLKYFYTDVPCKHGHVTKRYVSTGACAECGRIAAAEAARVKAAKARANKVMPTPEEVAQKKAEQAQRQRERQQAYQAEYRARPESKAYQDEYQKKYRERPEVRERHRAKSREYGAKRRAERPDAQALTQLRTRAPAAIIPLTQQEAASIKEVYLERNRLTDSTGVEYHVDHIWPLARGGVHHPMNLQILTEAENGRKGKEADLESPLVRQGLYCTLFGKGRLIKITRAV